jgi:hypothetical protein
MPVPFSMTLKSILGVTTMLTLEELLKERVQRLGQDHPAVQMLRNQITAEKSGKTLQELYLTGSVKKQPAANPQQ